MLVTELNSFSLLTFKFSLGSIKGSLTEVFFDFLVEPVLFAVVLFSLSVALESKLFVASALVCLDLLLVLTSELEAIGSLVEVLFSVLLPFFVLVVVLFVSLETA